MVSRNHEGSYHPSPARSLPDIPLSRIRSALSYPVLSRGHLLLLASSRFQRRRPDSAQKNRNYRYSDPRPPATAGYRLSVCHLGQPWAVICGAPYANTKKFLTMFACDNLDLLGADGTSLFLSPVISKSSSETWVLCRWHSFSQTSLTIHFPAATARKYLTLRILTVLVPCSAPHTTWVVPSVYFGSNVQPRLGDFVWFGSRRQRAGRIGLLVYEFG